MRVRLTFLGTGTSFGVPQIGCGCPVCTSADPRDRRTRCGALVDLAADGVPSRRVLIDTPPELRLQLTAADVRSLDAVLFTHDHADHIHGIDDLRAITMRRGEPLPMYAEAATRETLRQRFPYIVDPAMPIVAGTTRPEGRLVTIVPGVSFSIDGFPVLPIAVPHGRTPVVGFRFGDLAYITDAKTLPPEALAAVAGVRVLVLNALLRTPHPTHLSISEAVETAQVVGAEQTFFTHLTHHQSHAALAAELPDGMAPAHDGLVVTVESPDPI